MNGTAPVCPVSRDQPVPGQPPSFLLPAFRASDLPSLIAAVNAAIRNLGQLLGPGVPSNGFPVGRQPKPVSSVSIQSWWYEVDRVTNDGFIYNYDKDSKQFDRGQRVEVTRIYAIEFSASGSSVNQPMWWQWQEQPYTDGALQ